MSRKQTDQTGKDKEEPRSLVEILYSRALAALQDEKTTSYSSQRY
jgi:hypothetical protein